MAANIPRRTFVRTTAGAALGLTATHAARAFGPNDRIGLGFIGVANRGGQLIDAFLQHKDAEIVALCDVCGSTLEKANQRLDHRAAAFGDFRKLINRKDVDAVVIATPDHWHAIQTIRACDAGKDVYVEKPLSITVHEGRRMVQAARRNNRVVQVGTHMRSIDLYGELAELISSGKLGKVTVSRTYRLSNMYPEGIGRSRATPPPADLDWDMWLGPRPMRPYQDNITPYKFRWWELYSSQAANWGIHFIDLIRWMTGELAPASVCAMGGRFAVEDDRTIPDTMQATFQFASGRLAVFGQYEACGNPALAQPGDVELRGTQGTAYLRYLGGRRYQILPERGGQFQDPSPRIEPIEAKDTDGDPTVRHARNFLDCIKSRNRPAADVEIGHRSTTFSLLANISLATRSRLDWDARQERITNHDQANHLLHYEYRKPWKLE